MVMLELLGRINHTVLTMRFAHLVVCTLMMAGACTHVSMIHKTLSSLKSS